MALLYEYSRIVTHEGNMNPIMGEVDMVPDDDLNTRLKFYVSVFYRKLSGAMVLLIS